MDQAEQLRKAVKNSKNIHTSPKARVITITSGKGGVGKSNVAVNLAVHMRRHGIRVMIFDADLGLANIEVMFGCSPKYNLSDIIYCGKKMKDIITDGPMDIGLVSGGSGIIGMSNLSKNQLSLLINNLAELDELADVILIDTGAGISSNVMEFVSSSPEVLLVMTPEPSSLMDSYSLIKTLHGDPRFAPNGTKIEVVVNRTVSAEDGRFTYDKFSSVVSKFLQGEVHYYGNIPQDAHLERLVREQKIVSINAPNSKSSKAFEQLSKNLLYGEPAEAEGRRGILQLFSNFFK